MNGSTTPRLNSGRRSSVKCGTPIPCAIARACETAEDEQQLRSASFSWSAHSSSVTATASVDLAAQHRRHGGVDAAAHRDQRSPTGCWCGDGGALADCGAERAGERVGGELGGVELAWAETAQLLGDLPRADTRHLQDFAAARERHGCAAGRGRRAATLRLEAGIGDPVGSHADGELDPVAARSAVDVDSRRLRRKAAMALR